jgi:hypothetical protein
MLLIMCTVPKLQFGNILDKIMYGKYFESVFSVLLNYISKQYHPYQEEHLLVL